MTTDLGAEGGSKATGQVGDLPEEAYAAALAGLPGIGPARLGELLAANRPEAVWAAVRSGRVVRPRPRPRATSPTNSVAARPLAQEASLRPWSEVASRVDVGRRWEEITRSGIRVLYLGGPGLPAPFAEDPEPPGVLFAIGDLAVFDRPCVALIGTRNCTGYGRSMAFRLGRDLASCGVCVVSGLALGIDGAAHEGVLAAAGGTGPLGVAASGVDCPYPRRHRDLWRRVGAAGAIISENIPGQPAQAWRFPSRNRLIAAAASAVVVVESHSGGGSMLTVAAAADRGRTVLAVPGPVSSAASRGTNQLLYEGSTPVRDAGDVLAALGDFRPWPPPDWASVGDRPPRTKRSATQGSSRSKAPACPSRPHATNATHATHATQAELLEGPSVGSIPSRRLLDPATRRVLDAIEPTPTPTSTIAERTGLPIGALSTVLLALEADGLIRGQGLWWERCTR